MGCSSSECHAARCRRLLEMNAGERLLKSMNMAIARKAQRCHAVVELESDGYMLRE